MAIGDTNNGNEKGKLFENTYYSRLRFKNSEQKLSLVPTFRSGLLIFEISEMKEGFKYESKEAIHLSPTKARLFAEEIKKFIDYYLAGDIIDGKAFGVNAGMGDKISYIGIHADTDKNVFITIGKFDGNGSITESETIMLNANEYHFALEWDNINKNEVGKCYNDLIEINQIYDILVDFSRYMSGALAYSVADLTRFDNARILKKMDPIYDKLGIERMTYNNGNSSGGYKSNSFLDNSKNISNHTSVENIEDILS